jgi:hypothetical protein
MCWTALADALIFYVLRARVEYSNTLSVMYVVIPEAIKSKTKVNLDPKPNPPHSCLVR